MTAHVDIEGGKVVVDHDGLRVGDLVYRGKSSTVWRISSFWQVNGETLAALIPTEKGKYTKASCPPSVLTKVVPDE